VVYSTVLLDRELYLSIRFEFNLWTSFVQPVGCGPVEGFVRHSTLFILVYTKNHDNLYFDNLKLNIFDAVFFSAFLSHTTVRYPLHVSTDISVQIRFLVLISIWFSSANVISDFYWFPLMCSSALNYFLTSLVVSLALNLPVASQFGSDWKYHTVNIGRRSVSLNYILVW